MLVVNRFVIPSGELPDNPDEPFGASGRPESGEQSFVDRAHTAIRALADCDGFIRAQFGRAADDPRYWCLVTEWRSVGAYRRALSSFQVKLDATPLLAEAAQDPSAYEVLATCEGGAIIVTGSDRAPGA